MLLVGVELERVQKENAYTYTIPQLLLKA